MSNGLVDDLDNALVDLAETESVEVEVGHCANVPNTFLQRDGSHQNPAGNNNLEMSIFKIAEGFWHQQQPPPPPRGPGGTRETQYQHSITKLLRLLWNSSSLPCTSWIATTVCGGTLSMRSLQSLAANLVW